MIPYNELKVKYEHWCNWKYATQNGKTKKAPVLYDINNREQYISVSTHQGVAFSRVKQSQMGIILGHPIGDHKLVGIDLDDCVDKNGAIAQWAQDIIDQTNSYTEFSPSGNGLHILCLVHPDTTVNTKMGGIEVYTQDRYFTVTENVYLDKPICDCTAFFEHIAAQSQGGQDTPNHTELYPEFVPDEKLNRISEKVLKAMYEGHNEHVSDRSGNDAYCVTYLYTHEFSRNEILWLMKDTRFEFGKKQNERNDNGRYQVDTINRVCDYEDRKKGTDKDTDEIETWLKNEGYELWYDTWRHIAMCNDKPIDELLIKRIQYRAKRADVSSYVTTDKAIGCILSTNQSHPLKEWFSDTKWNGHDYIGELFGAIQTSTPREYAEEYIRFWFVNAVAKAFNHPTRQNIVLVLHGMQGTNKSTALQSITPRPKWFSSYSATEVMYADKDMQLSATKHLVIEIEELQLASRRVDAGTIKAFLTKRQFNVRAPYDKQAKDLPVTTSYIATTNDGKFFVDPTGNRRFAVLENVYIDLQKWLAVDKEQLWAQAYALYMANEYERMDEAIYAFMNDNNKCRVNSLQTEITTLIEENFIKCEHIDGLTPDEVVFAINNIEHFLDLTKHQDKMLLNKVLTQLGYTKKRVREGKNLTYRYDIKLSTN